MNNPNLYSGKRFRQAIQHFLLGRTAQAIAFFILTLWLVRLLDPADYGAYMVLWGMVEMMVPLSSLGMLEAVRRFLPELATRGAPGVLIKFVHWMTLIRFVIIVSWAALIAVFWLDIAAWIGLSVVQQEATFIAVGLTITITGFRYASEMLECLLEQRWSQFTRALMSLGRLFGVAIIVAFDNLTLQRLLEIDLAVSLICFLLAEYFLARKLNSLPGIGNLRLSIRDIVTFAWHMTGVNLFRAAASFGALRIIVARTLGLETAGMYAFLQQLLMFVGRYLPANLLANIIRPMLVSRYVDGEIGVVKQGMALLWKSNILIIAITIAAISVAGNPIITLMSGGRFADADIIVLIMLLSLGATSQGQLVSMVMQIFSYTNRLRYFSVLCLLTPVAVFFGSNWGLLGVAVGIVISEWLQNNLVLFWLNRQAGRIELDWLGALRGLGLILLLVAIGLAVENQLGSWWALAFVLLTYGPGLVLVKPLSHSDKELLSRGLPHGARLFTPFVREG